MHDANRALAARVVPAARLASVLCVLVLAACGGGPHGEGQKSAAPPDTPGPLPRAASSAPAKAPTPEEIARHERFLATARHQFLRAYAAGARDDARRTAPYFLVDCDDPDQTRLPLEHTRVTAEIADSIADVRVTQVYRNRGTRPLEAIYVFPASSRAAIHALKMTIGQRVIEAVIREKEAARQEYEAARTAGHTATLLEQWRPNVFQMNVANIQPGDEIQVEVGYVELLVPEERIYEFVFPTVVGPRYVRPGDTEAWTVSPHGPGQQTTDQPRTPTPGHDLAVDVVVHSGIPIRQTTSPSHPLQVEFPDPRTAHLWLPPSREAVGHDLVLRYQLAGAQVESGLLLYPGGGSGAAGDKENYFLFTLQPPERVATEDVLPREYLFIVDVSGSMGGFPLETSKQLMHELLTQLRPEDRFDVLTFAGGSALLAPTPLVATPRNIDRASEVIDHFESGGGTELLPALERALALPRTPNTSRIVVLLTDGFVTVEKEAFALVQKNLGRANLFVFGIGTSVNRHLIEGLAHAGQGEPFVVLRPEEAKTKARTFANYVRAPVLRNIVVKFDGFETYDVEPPALPDLFAERPVVVHGKYRGELAGQVRVTGAAAGGDFSRTIDVAAANRSPGNVALRYLWARQRIQRLSDFAHDRGEAQRAEITRLGLEHHLMTQYTSFVAADTAARGEDAHGVGGLGLMGSGRGGGGTGEGTIGLGTIGTIGHGGGGGGSGGSGVGYGYGYASGAGMLVGRSAAAVKIAAPANKVRFGAAQVQGSLDKEVIRRVIRRHLNEVRLFYDKALAQTPGLAGQIVVRFVIAANGRVTEAAVVSSTLPGDALQADLLQAIRGWQFPPPRGGGEVIISYPFLFHP
jgi:Ca-activated chloride channel family protein